MQGPWKTRYDVYHWTRAESILLVTHSYGGIVGTEAVAEELGRKFRLPEGKPGGVIGILCVYTSLMAHGAWHIVQADLTEWQ